MRKTAKLSSAMLLFAAIGTLGFNSCKKKDKDKPEITLTSPANGTTYNNGDTIFIVGTVEDENLHTVNVKITSSNNMVNFNKEEHIHDKPHKMNLGVILDSITDHTNFTLKVTAKDHEGNESDVSVNGHVMP